MDIDIIILGGKYIMSIVIRGCHIGEGRPKVIIPIVEASESKILERALEFSELCIDCVEWRVDWFEQCNDSLFAS